MLQLTCCGLDTRYHWYALEGWREINVHARLALALPLRVVLHNEAARHLQGISVSQNCE